MLLSATPLVPTHFDGMADELPTVAAANYQAAPLSTVESSANEFEVASVTWTGSQNWALLDDPTRRALWVWHPGSPLTNNAFRTNSDGSQDLLLDFAQNKSISDLYVFGSTYEWNYDDLSQGRLANESFWVNFNAKANALGIRVWLMYYLYDATDDIRMTTDYNGILVHAVAVHNFNQAHPASAFAGMQSDQEPNNPARYPALLENMKRAQEYLDANEVNFLSSQALRPKWHNDVITWNGATKTMNQHVMDTITHGAMMAYNDNINTVRDWSNQVVNYATSLGKQVSLGFEVDYLGTGGAMSATWWEEIRAEPVSTRFQVNHDALPVTFEDAMDITTTEQSVKAGYDRQAIHEYDSYFEHWFGMTPQQYVNSLGGFYNSSVINPPKVNLTQDNANYNPIAYNVSAETQANTSVNINVLASAHDLDGDALSVVIVTQGTHGGVIINGDGTVKYTPNSGFFGVDNFTYTVGDGYSNPQTRTVTVQVEEPDNIPGDFNGDHKVDGDDLVIWQASYGINGDGDADGNGITNGRDFLIWQRNFTGPSSISSPAIAGHDSANVLENQPAIIQVSPNDSDPNNGTIADTKDTTDTATVRISAAAFVPAVLDDDFESGTLSEITTNTAHRPLWINSPYAANLYAWVSGQREGVCEMFASETTDWVYATQEFITRATNTSTTVSIEANPYPNSLIGEDGYAFSVVYFEEELGLISYIEPQL